MKFTTRQQMKRNKRMIEDILENQERKRIYTIRKEAALEARKTDPAYLKQQKIAGFTQSIYNEQKKVYEQLYDIIEQKSDELINLILEDLGLNENVEKELTVEEIIDVFNFYESKGLIQIKNAIDQRIINEFMPIRITPYQKLFKKLIKIRAEFLIVAPKECLKISLPYKKIKDDKMKIALVENLEKCDFISTPKFKEQFPKLYDFYLKNKNNELER